MHNNRIKGKWLAVLAVLLPWVSWAQVPPPVVRNVLDTNLVSFGTTGQALFRITALPLINWSNVLQAIGITNVINSIVGTSNNLYILKLDGVGTNTTIYGSPAGTNWTVTGPGGFLNTNVAGGFITGVNGRLIISANGTTTGGASNLVGGLTLGHTNDQRAYLTIGLTNGSGITNQYAILVTTNGADGGTPLMSLGTNGSLYARNTITAGAGITASTYIQPSYFLLGTLDAAGTSIRRSTIGGIYITGGGGVGSPSNNLFVAGGGVYSNGLVVKIHNATSYTNNASPVLTVIPPIAGPYDGATWGGYVTNILEIQDTNGTPAFVINSNAAVGIGTNAPTAQLSVFGQTNNGAVIFQVGSRNIATASAGGTNAIIVLTNGNVGIGTAPSTSGNGRLAVANLGSFGGSLECVGQLTFGAGPNGRMNQGGGFVGISADFNGGNTNMFGLMFGTNRVGTSFITDTNCPMLATFITSASSANPVGLGSVITAPEIWVVANKTNGTAPANLRVPNGVLYGSNTVAASIVISNPPGAMTNSLEVQGTNGIGNGKDFVVDASGKHGIGTNLPTALVSIFGTNDSGILFQVGSRNIATATAGGTNALMVGTNGNVGVKKPPTTYALDVNGSINAASGGSVSAANNVNMGWGQLGSAQAGWVTLGSTAGGSSTNLFGLILGSSTVTGTGDTAPMLRTFITGWSNVTVPEIWVTANATNAPTPANLRVPNGILYGSNTYATAAVVSNTLSVAGNQIGAFGALMNNTSNTVVCAGGAGVYTNICGTGFTTITTNGFIGGTQAISAGLTNLNAGYYRVFINASYLGANATTYEFDVVTNGAACTLLEVKNTTDSPARFRTSSAGGIIYLPANCGVQMMVQDGGGGSTINVFRSSITIGTP